MPSNWPRRRRSRRCRAERGAGGELIYLKAITLKGFKSFPDRTRLEFGPGVSVIVGPNGSGKSNVTDAVLWALGEQSPLAVRGQSMQDVIFGGAPGRQAARGAEVELVLDDSEGTLGLPNPEVSIVRRLDRSGDGEYRLAGARCRLVDVLEVLSDTGLGREMHSVISQGRVEAIVTSKPRERRLLIEEAAGLGKHRKRRRRAQLKLARTQDNLDRALDVEREARSRLRPLKRQAEAAELHARIERQTLEARWELGRDRLREQQAALARAESDVAAQRQRRTEVEAQLREVSHQREQAEEALASRSARREELSRRCFAAGSAADLLGFRAEAVRAAADNLVGRLGRQRAALEQLLGEHTADRADPDAQLQIEALQREIAALDRDREAELARQLAELEQQHAGAVRARQEREAATEQTRVARVQADGRLEKARRAVRESERAVEAARREAARIGGELAAVNQFLRGQESASEGAVSLSAQLQVDPGYEHAVAAALDGRLGAAVVEDLHAGGLLLDRAGADGGRTLVAGGRGAANERQQGSGREGGVPHSQEPPVSGAERLLDRVRGPEDSMALARLLLRDAWVVEDLAALPVSFGGLAATRAGRVWAPATRELRQASAHGEERVLAERNRRLGLIGASEDAAGAEHRARAELKRLTEQVAEFDAGCERVIEANRAAVRARDEAAEQERRVAAQIGRRRA
ncbi:MAG: AAA family ATPase, partial [Actinomycetota bacterium]|nr:AAA family ATPase [Actinomycetota bacterium]